MIAFLMGLKTISPKMLNQLRQETRILILDVNSRQSWRDARVPGARNLDPDKFEKNDLPVDANSQIVFYCSNPWCRKAPRAARRAQGMGYANVSVMSAGITGWLDAKLPNESGA